MKTTLIEGLEKRGYRGRVVSIERLGELRDEIENRQNEGDLDQEFLSYLGKHLDFTQPQDLQWARSLIVVAVEDPQVRFSFAWNGLETSLIVPPTYLHSGPSDGRVESVLSEILEPEGYRVAKAALPKKLLAVRSGLAEYGRNNIAFVAGTGSFARLSVFYSDLPCHQDDWQEARMLDRCQDCSACLNSCPTGAISPDRFLLRAERCTTFHNEMPAERPFPDWIDPSSHHCLVGCLHCQRVCPENREVLDWVEDGAEFSSEETELLLQGVEFDLLPPAMAEKLERWDLTQLLELFPRNLEVLLDSRV
jgi:epoxyqueuosine reductase